IALGYGREKCGRVGKGVGFNANLIRTSDGFWFGSGFSLAATGKTHVHATTQEHGAMNEIVASAERQNGRPLAREATVAEYKKDPTIVEEMAEVPVLNSIYPQVKYDKGY